MKTQSLVVAMPLGLLRSSGVLVGLLAACLFGTPSARAEMVRVAPNNGAQGFVDVGTAIAALTNDINDAGAFTIGALVSTEDSHGYFDGLPMQFFGTVTFNLADPLSLQFGTTEFGTFASKSIRQLSNDPIVGSRSFLVEGLFAKGTYGEPLAKNPVEANFTLSLNQNAGTGAPISVNATLEIPTIQPVPEPSSLVLATAGLGTAALVWLRRRGGSRSAVGRGLPAGLDTEAGTVEEECAVVADRGAGV